MTSRHTNVQRHREVQDAVKQAVGRALALLEGPPGGAAGAAGAAAGMAAGTAAGTAVGMAAGTAAGTAAASNAAAAAPYELAVHSASYHAFSLPLAKPLTTAAGGEAPRRRGFLLQLSLAGASGAGVAHGVGEVAPLPGLHRESLEEAEAQLALLCQLLAGGPSPAAASSNGSSAAAPAAASGGVGVTLPLTAALLGGRLGTWLQQGLGVAPDSLLPSVRCGLEAALLSAIAQASRGEGDGGMFGLHPAGLRAHPAP